MNETQAVEKIKAMLLGGPIETTFDDPEVSEMIPIITKAKFRLSLGKDGIVVIVKPKEKAVRIFYFDDNDAKSTKPSRGKPKPKPKPKPKDDEATRRLRLHHTYVPPHFDEDVVAILTDEVPHNIWLVGPTGTGKTEYAHHLAARLGRKLVQINCREDMATASFLGDRTVEVDEDSAQNFIKFLEGPAVKAMQEGLDEDGNEVGAPAILFIDEAGACPAHISIALNRLLETRKVRREVALDGDSGRVVRSHSGFRVILAANTTGRGLTGMSDSLYTAQANAHDISTLNRVTAYFRFGYDRAAEKHIMQEKTGDDTITRIVLGLRDKIRGAIKRGELPTPFSTRMIVAIADMYRVLDDIGKAIYYVCYNAVTPEEVPTYNEVLNTLLGRDILAEMQKDGSRMDY